MTHNGDPSIQWRHIADGAMKICPRNLDTAQPRKLVRKNWKGRVLSWFAVNLIAGKSFVANTICRDHTQFGNNSIRRRPRRAEARGIRRDQQEPAVQSRSRAGQSL